MTKAASRQGGCFLFLQGGIRTQTRLGSGYANSNSSLKRLEQVARNLYNNSRVARPSAMQTVHKGLCVRAASADLKEDFPCRTVIRAISVITASGVCFTVSRWPGRGWASTGIGRPTKATTRARILFSMFSLRAKPLAGHVTRFCGTRWRGL